MKVEHNVRILLVDDEEANRSFLSRRLERAGYTVDTASSGAQALVATRHVPYDLVLLDLMMPHIDGAEVVRRMRDSESQGRLPVIMLSADTNQESVLRLLDLGADDYMFKPVDFKMLLAKITAVLRRATAQSGEMAAQSAPDTEDRSRFPDEPDTVKSVGSG